MSILSRRQRRRDRQRARHPYQTPLRFEPLEDRRLLTTVAELTYIETEEDNVSGVDGLQGLFDIVVSPDGKHVYTAGTLEDGLATFSRDAATGELTFVEALFDGVGGINSLDAVRGVAVSPDGKHVYTAALLDSALTAFSRNSTTGKLTFIEAELDIGALVGLSGASDVIVSPDGKHVYVAARTDDAVSVYSRDSVTGELTFVESKFDGSGGVNGLDAAERLTISPDGKHVYVAAEGDDAVSVFSRDAMTGALTFVEAQLDGIGGVDGLDQANSVAVSPDGMHVYVSSGLNLSPLDEDWLATFSRNPMTGELTFLNHISSTDPLPCTPFASVLSDTVVTVSPDGKFVYVTKGGAIVQFSRDMGTGLLSAVDAECTGLDPDELFAELLNPTSVALSPDGLHAYVGDLVGFLSAFHTQNRAFFVNSTANTADANFGDALCDDGAGNCTLRAAIQQANATTNLVGRRDLILFDIPGAGPHTISPTGALPSITEPVVIDGTSEPNFAGTLPVVELNGTGAGVATNGLTITAGNSTVRGLAVNRFGGSGIVLSTGGGNKIQQNMIGTNPAGTADQGNGSHGVVVFNSANNLLGTTNAFGGPTTENANVISGNAVHGVYVTRSGSTNNQIANNFIGLGLNGVTPLGNDGAGVRIDQDAANNVIGSPANVISANASSGVNIVGPGTTNNTVSGNKIGTDNTGMLDRGNVGSGVNIDNAPGNIIGVPFGGNLISGNNADGVFISGASASGNVLRGNKIGVNETGNAALPNGQSGVTVNDAPNNSLGGTAANDRNIVSGNNKTGVFIVGGSASGNKIEGNFIGTNSTGTDAVGNGLFGVVIRDAPNNTVGGAASGAGNLVSGNSQDGIAILNAGSTGNVVIGNKIGTDVTGTADVGNVKSGVLIWKGPGNRIGGLTTAERNIISGNNLYGVRISTALASSNVVQGNFIGTDITGAAALPNSDAGIQLANAQNTTVGGGAAGARNVVSGNGNHGILLVGAGVANNNIRGNYIGVDVTGSVALGNAGTGLRIASGAHDNTIGGDSTAGQGNVISANGSDGVFLVNATTRNNTVAGNLIGTDHTGAVLLGNTRHGVYVIDGEDNTIGGTAAGAGNRIAGNGQSGVVILGATATGNAIRRNSVFSNNALGIDLNLDGVTANDTVAGSEDIDSGPNKRQNFPVLTMATLSGTNLDMTYSVPSKATHSAYPLTIEFFLADAAGQEGQVFLGTDTYLAGEALNSAMITLNVAGQGVSGSSKIVATATDANGNTSEFSANILVSVPLLAASEPFLSAEACREFRGDSTVDAAELEKLDTALQPIIDAAIIRWQQAGLDTEQLALLNKLDIRFADLEGGYLGMTTGNTILLDSNAAGYGWYIDPTPLDDGEFSSGSRPSPLDSRPSSLDSHRMDLLTAVMHEMGHVLGYDHASDFETMIETLAAGVRRTG